MEMRTLGRTGVQVGRIGLGTEYLLNQPQEIGTAVIRRAACGALEGNADDCLACGVCTTRCPFGVDVVTQMRLAGGTFA
ncbi:MAG: hypothetical protein MUF84_09995 [Anaerolineae bacterium]|nr:hypothetical protein [Anaerolineae bacterium]